MATIILGAQWGDEGGGHNAGHSIVANGVSCRYALLGDALQLQLRNEDLRLLASSFHLLPSGLVNPNCVHDQIFISDRVHIDLDLHIAVHGLEEVELGERKRSGIRLAEVFNAELFESKLRRLASHYQKQYGDLIKYHVEEELARFQQYRPKLAK
ncbi:hypothetical protein DL764_006650 [Monosporascus ibericus]|uniref:Adenylosuccinate synthetase n=1 Tax=Monosporascus ibericus TaxID=155417 RepID=A0A4Q4T7V8_9PEZI|nr:hypothetical protein DL764_006650 [Monosporascus ibericus]